MYDAPDNQVVYLPCILPFMKQTAHFIINGRIVHLAEFLSFADDKYVGIDLLNLFDNMFFNVPRTCCCSWLCLLIYFEVIRKKTSEKRTRPRVCTVVLLLIRCTVKKQQKNSGFVRAPRKSATYWGFSVYVRKYTNEIRITATGKYASLATGGLSRCRHVMDRIQAGAGTLAV